MAAPAEGAPAEGAPREKKRRRRRRGKKNHAAAGAPGEGAKAESGESAKTEGAEAKPDEDATGNAAKDQNAKAKGAKGPTGGKRGKGKKARGPRPENAPQRERTAFHVGEEVFGRVTSVTEHAIMVDLSGKALAIFDRQELAADDLVPDVGDRFVAHVHGDGSRGGFVVLTRKPLREEEAKPRLEEASKSGQTVTGLVTGVVKGGIEVDVDGLRAFAPGSHVDLRPGADLAHLIGHRLEFTVAQYAKRGRDVVVSRKGFIETEAQESRKSSLSKLEVGSVVKGIVRSVVPYGAFIAIPSADDVEGLVHMTEASHDRGAKLADVFRVGAEIDVKVLRVDDKGKLWLSHKAATLDPWQEAMKTYAQGTRHKGKVLRLLPFGAFIELAPGIEGLLHTSDLSFKRIEHPKDILKEDEEIDVIVADVDRGSHKISLHPAPPPGEENEPRQKVIPHKGVKVAVVTAESAGLVVRIVGITGRQSRAFIPAGHTGTERGTDLRKHFPPGTRLEAKVIEIDPRRGEAKLSLRALKEDTEKAAYHEYRASVAKASKFGTLGDLLANAKKR
ncbi:MAG TPA: S1 RNA-binding domain-containing protein [Polyangiaceae bacterium]|nr:S1 RNA-binding domain-containing protein [Polyangiaceae bacterium]